MDSSVLAQEGASGNSLRLLFHRFRILQIIFLLVSMILLLGWERLRTADEPLDSNLTTWMIMGHGMLQGRHLYSDLIDHDPPGTHTVFMVAQYLAGGRKEAVFFINWLTSCLTLVAVYITVFWATQDFPASCLAAAGWVIIGGDPALHANQPAHQSFVNLFGLCAIGCLFRATSLRHSRASVFFCSTALLGASLFWEPALFLEGALLLGYVITQRQKGSPYRELWIDLIALVMPVVAGWLVLVGWYRFTGQLQAFYLLNVLFNRFYASYGGSILSHLWSPLIPFSVSAPWGPPNWLYLIGLFGPASLALAELFLAGADLRWILVFYGVAIRCMTILPAHEYPEYFMLWLPFCCIGFGFLWSGEGLIFRSKTAARGFLILCLSLLLWRQAPFYLKTPEEWSRMKFGEEFIVTRHIGCDLVQLLSNNESFFDWGIETGLYFYSGRYPLTGAFYNYFSLVGPLSSALSRRILLDLEKNPPELFITSERHRSIVEVEQHPVIVWAMAHYRPFIWAAHRGSFHFYARRSGELEKRIIDGKLPCNFDDER